MKNEWNIYFKERRGIEKYLIKREILNTKRDDNES